MAKNITSTDFQSEVLNSQTPVLLDFYADWCGPCKMQAPILEEFSNEVDGVKVFKVNVDEEMALAQQFGIMSIPTLVVVKGGKVVDKRTGLQQKADLISMTS